jgi:hypothetical protein
MRTWPRGEAIAFQAILRGFESHCSLQFECMVKYCYKCKETKDKNCFSKNRARKDGLSSQCKECHKAIRKSHYEQNKSKVIRQVADRKFENKNWVRKLKNKPCMDCGSKYPYYVMDFDHRENKEFGISWCVKNGFSKERILAEMSKCDLVCSNCHRERTHNDLG